MKAPTAGGEATRWLKQFLEHRNGLALSSVVMTDGQSAGHHPRALQRAAKKLRVSFHPMGMPAKVWWVLPGAQLPLVTP